MQAFSAEKIASYVEANKEEALSFLKEIVSTPSVTGDEAKVAEIFKKKMEDAGFVVTSCEADPGRPNLFGEWKGKEPGKRFVFNGHMDVFPPDDNGMPYGPWGAKIHDGKLYGRGAADMKGGDACAMMAAIFLKRMGFDPKGSVLLTWMVDEEHGSRFGANACLAKGLIQGDIGICPEGTSGMIRTKHGGILRGFITYKAVSQHTAAPYKFGDNALVKGCRAVEKLLEINERLEKLPPAGGVIGARLSVTVFHAGDAANVHPGLATIWFDRRVMPGEDPEAALKEITDALDSLKSRPGYDYGITVTNNRPPLDNPDDDPFILLMKESFVETYHREPVLYASTGGSDAANIRRATGIVMPNFSPAPKLGPGGSGDAGEYIGVQDYLDGIKYFMVVLKNAMG